MIIIQGKQGYCDITVTDAAGNLVPFDAPEQWEVTLFDFYRHTVPKTWQGDEVEAPATESTTFRIFIAGDLTAKLKGRHDLQIKAVYPGERSPVDVARIENFLNVQEAY